MRNSFPKLKNFIFHGRIYENSNQLIVFISANYNSVFPKGIPSVKGCFPTKLDSFFTSIRQRRFRQRLYDIFVYQFTRVCSSASLRRWHSILKEKQQTTDRELLSLGDYGRPFFFF